jgi:hypothetical protein
MPNVRGTQKVPRPLPLSLILMVASARLAVTLEYPQHTMQASPKSQATQHIQLFNTERVTLFQLQPVIILLYHILQLPKYHSQ